MYEQSLDKRLFCLSFWSIKFILYFKNWTIWCAFISFKKIWFQLMLNFSFLLIIKINIILISFYYYSCFSVSFLTGPLNHYKYVTSKEKLPFMFGYITSLLSTLYFSLWMRSTPFTLLSLTVHLILIFWFLLNSVPFGQKGLTFFGRLCSSMVRNKVSNSLPV